MENHDCNHNCSNCNNAAELAAAVNAAASLIAKNKSVEEIEMAAVLFDMLSDTLFGIAIIQKKQDRLCERKRNSHDQHDSHDSKK